ncbi:hypothetical protein CRD59_07270 [Bifidobacterium xylocopae]|uniref:Uncharacterized protein n=2 Tax=Bifidobacterium xylocopae TaxID=2493119 RepID=A0A366KAP9_9BIFI|nr:hypothetical protein CRD59_07270 [Bifidobacterium xylocopae]
MQLMEHASFAVGCAVAVVTSLILCFGAFAVNKYRESRDRPKFKIMLEPENSLAQPVLKTSYGFSAAFGRQDEVLFDLYGPGTRFAQQEYAGIISRWKKERTSKGYRYIGYFAEFEYQELPAEFSVADNKDADDIVLTPSGISLSKGRLTFLRFDWDEFLFRVEDNRIIIENLEGVPVFENSTASPVLELHVAQFAHDGNLLEELLTKYANEKF